MNDTNLSRVDNVRCGIPWLVLPTVYSDALSYEEQFGKFCKALNDVIANVNVLPDYIKQEIENYINSGIIGDQIEQTIGNWILNVKYPPTENITPAKGDGTTDDTETFQQCIDYAAANGGGCLFVPAGKYLVGPLTLKENVSIVGFDRYSTVLVCKGGSTGAVISSATGNSAILGLTVDARMSTQVNDVNGISLMGQDYQIDNVIVADAYNAIQFVGNGHFQCTNVVIEQVVNKGMAVSGDNNEVHVSDVFVSSAGKNATCAFDLSGVNGLYEIKSAIAVNEYAILLGGSHNVVRAFVSGTEATIDDTGVGNSFEIYNDVIKQNINNAQVNVSGDLSVAASHITEESDAKTVSVNGTLQVNAANANENVAGTKKIKSQELILDPTEPLTYKNPMKLNRKFNYVSFKDKSDKNYSVLVDNPEYVPLDGLKNQLWIMNNAGTLPVLYQNNSEPIYNQGFTLNEDYFYTSARNSSETTNIIYKVNRITGEYTTKSFSNLGHCNSMTTDGTYLYVTDWKSGNSTCNIVILDFSLNVLATVPAGRQIGQLAFDKVTNTLYAASNWTVLKITRSELSLTFDELFTITEFPFTLTGQGFGVYDDIFFFPCSKPEAMLIYDNTGNLLSSHAIWPYVSYVWRLREIEDIEIVDNILYMQSTWLVPATETGEVMTVIQYSTYNISTPQAVDCDIIEQNNTYTNLIVNNNTFNFIRGNNNLPFNDIWEAAWAANGILALTGNRSSLTITNTTKEYYGGSIRGVALQHIVGNGSSIKYFDLYSTSDIKIENLNVVGLINTDNMARITRGSAFLVDVKFNSGDASVLNGLLVSDGLVMVRGFSYSGNASSVINNDHSIVYAAYNVGKMRLPTTGVMGINGIKIASNINITNNPTKVVLDNLIMTSGFTRANNYALCIGGIEYYFTSAAGSYTLNIDNNTITIVVSNTGITLSATSNIRANYLLMK